jgi:hypothetical protein
MQYVTKSGYSTGHLEEPVNERFLLLDFNPLRWSVSWNIFPRLIGLSALPSAVHISKGDSSVSGAFSRPRSWDDVCVSLWRLVFEKLPEQRIYVQLERDILTEVISILCETSLISSLVFSGTGSISKIIGIGSGLPN